MTNMNNDCEEISAELVASRVKSNIKQDIVKELLNISFQDPQTALNNEVVTLITEVAKCLVMESCLRTADLALSESKNGQLSPEITYGDTLKCLPQLMLDFP